MKSTNASNMSNEKLRKYLKHQGISTTSGPVGENITEAMARLDKLLQEYRLTYKLHLIQKLEPIEARAYARSKIASAKNAAGRPHREKHCDAQDANTNENATNRTMGEGSAAARVDFFAPRSSTTHTISAKPAEG